MIQELKEGLKQEAALLWCAGALLFLSAICLIVNLTVTHYQGIGYQLPSMVFYLPWGVGVLYVAAYLRKIKASERIALFFDTVGKIYFLYLVYAIGCYAIQFTPFHLVDNSLLQFDQWLGFNSSAVYHFTISHEWINKIENFSYDSLSYLFAIPLIMAVLLEKKSIRIFFLGNLISALIAYAIYYFFPTTVPAHVIPGIIFDDKQYMVIAQWYEIHFHLNNAVHIGDLIGFPSYHVVWAILLVYTCKNRKWLFYPVSLLSVALIFATMGLGWHFLADVIGGLIVGFAAIYISLWIDSKMHKEACESSADSLTLISEAQLTQFDFVPTASSAMNFKQKRDR